MTFAPRFIAQCTEKMAITLLAEPMPQLAAFAWQLPPYDHAILVTETGPYAWRWVPDGALAPPDVR